MQYLVLKGEKNKKEVNHAWPLNFLWLPPPPDSLSSYSSNPLAPNIVQSTKDVFTSYEGKGKEDIKGK